MLRRENGRLTACRKRRGKPRLVVTYFGQTQSVWRRPGIANASEQTFQTQQKLGQIRKGGPTERSGDPNMWVRQIIGPSVHGSERVPWLGFGLLRVQLLESEIGNTHPLGGVNLPGVSRPFSSLPAKLLMHFFILKPCADALWRVTQTFFLIQWFSYANRTTPSVLFFRDTPSSSFSFAIKLK